MLLVVADTSPIFYLLTIGHIDILPQLFGTVLIPEAVYRELSHPAAPTEVRMWSVRLPLWVEVRPAPDMDDVELQSLGAGERAAIALALSMRADLLLIDERKGTRVALNKGFEATGTLGALGLAAQRGLVDLADSFARLKQTNFRYRQEVMDGLLDRGEGKTR